MSREVSHLPFATPFSDTVAKQYKLYSPIQIQNVKNPSYTNTSELWKSSRREACFDASLQWSAMLLNRTRKAKIKPLFELNRTAASVASSNNGMPTFLTPSTQKKNFCRMLEGEKNNMQVHTRRKKFHCESRC